MNASARPSEGRVALPSAQRTPRLTLVVAYARNRVIGRDNA
jgi:hypothetical protein